MSTKQLASFIDFIEKIQIIQEENIISPESVKIEDIFILKYKLKEMEIILKNIKIINRSEQILLFKDVINTNYYDIDTFIYLWETTINKFKNVKFLIYEKI